MTRLLEKVAGIVVLLSLVNVFAAAIVAATLGGHAYRGKVEGGHYYFGHPGHLREVPHWVWTYSRIHMASMFVCVLLFFAGCAV